MYYPMLVMASPFTPKTLALLRGLKRHNDREWFRSRFKPVLNLPHTGQH